MVESLDLFGEVTPAKKKQSQGAKRRNKSDSAYRTISEVADKLGVATHVLRFWETKFPQIQPMKRNAGRRYYRPEDIKIIEEIKHLLHEKGFTIRGVQALFKERGNKNIIKDKAAGETNDLSDFLSELKEIRQLLD